MTRAIHSQFRGGAAALFGLLAAASVIADPGPRPCPPTGARIFLRSDGSVELNGRVLAAVALAKELKAIKPTPTEACYSRANPAAEPPPTYTVVPDAIVALSLPVSMYSDSTFQTQLRLR
jgi:hypothetical protein